jgi:thiol-disulfide isomerase/thioredoxin
MRQLVFILFLSLLVEYKISGQVSGSQNIRTVNFSQLEPLLNYSNDTLYMLNFWATWCAPCVEELPVIEQVREKYNGYKLKIILVSLDFPSQLNSRLVPFLISNQIHSEVFLLDDPDQNSWINKVDPNWSGEIPFTLIYRDTLRESYPQSFYFQELDSIINLKLL